MILFLYQGNYPSLHEEEESTQDNPREGENTETDDHETNNETTSIATFSDPDSEPSEMDEAAQTQYCSSTQLDLLYHKSIYALGERFDIRHPPTARQKQIPRRSKTTFNLRTPTPIPRDDFRHL